MAALNLLQVTDTHLVGDAAGRQRGVVTLDALQAVLRLASKDSHDVVLLTGDVVHDDPEGYDWARRELSALGKPVLCIPGNHDDPDLLREALAGEPFRHCGHHDFRGWRLVMLDSHVPGGAEGLLRPSELARLEIALESAGDLHVLVVLHHHPIESGSRWLDTVGLVNAKEFLDIIDRHSQVRGILWGHVHQSHDSLRRNAHGELRLMSTPSTCVQFLPKSDDFVLDTLPPGFRTLQLYADGRIDSQVRWLG
ncbi:MAG: phosphodiesterase [Gammaproteobacteria bacterium]|jgi:Icc protein|nr:phosphodiesterase [Gammaproteobacteria bacterium]